jgi:citrate synthase
VVLGSAEACGRFLTQCLNDQAASGETMAEAAARQVQALRAARAAIPGFGHPQHSEGDPRALLLLRLAEEKGAAGRHIEMLYAVRDALPGALGRALPINVNGAIPAVMLDAGFPLAALKGISLLARAAGLIGHLTEEAETPIGFILSGKAAEGVRYEGE